MLFTALQNEGKDLLGNFSFQQEYYFLLAPNIQEQMKQFVLCHEYFNELQEQGNNMEDVDDECKCP